MATFQFTVEQISFSSEDLPIDSSSLDSLSSVVDPNVDFMVDADKNLVKSEIDKNVAWISDTLSVNTKKKNKMEENHDSNASFISDSNVNGSKSENVETSYPTIPIAVARYMNQNNPEIFQEAGKYLTSDVLKTALNINENNKTSQDAASTPLHAMSATSEALALQHSVIGNLNVKPVSADVVAQVVAKTKVQLSKKKLPSSHVSSVKNEPNSPEEYLVGSCNENEEIFPKTELIRYPSEIISSTVEKRSWFSNNSFEIQNDVLPKMMENSSPKKTQLISRSSSQSSINSISYKKGLRTNGSDLPKVHLSKSNSKLNRHRGFTSTESPYEQYVDSSVDYETESSMYELDSLCSEAFETESNYSEISGIDDEIFQVRRGFGTSRELFNSSGNKSSYNMTSQNLLTLKDANTSPLKSLTHSTCDKATETEEQNFQLMREKASLEGRLESVTKDQSELIKERDYYSSLATSFEAQVKSLKNQLQTLDTEKKNAIKLYETQTKEHDNWDNIIKEYQSIIETKNIEIKTLKEDLSESEQANTRTRIGCEELKMDIDSRDAAIAGLKKKIAELHVEVQIHLQGKIQLENEVKNVRLEMETLQKSKDWFQEQLHTTQESRNKLHQQLILTQNELATASRKFETVSTEKNQLKLELNHSQQKAVAEKEILMKRLETIEADMKERESLFDEIQKDKGSAEDSLIERIRKIEEEKSNLMSLSFTVSDQAYQLKSLTNQCEENLYYIQLLEKEKAELSKQVAILQKTANDKDLDVQQLKQEIKDLNVNINRLETARNRSEEVINKLKEERTATDVALAAANEEKRIVNESLKAVSENLNKFQANFKHMKTELITQTSRADQLLKEKTLMEETIKKNNISMQVVRQEFEQKISSESQNRNVLLDDLQKKKNEVENVLSVYSKDLLNYQQLVETLSLEKSELTNTIAILQQSIQKVEEKVSILNEENTSLKREIINNEKQQDELRNNLKQNPFKNDIENINDSEAQKSNFVNDKKAAKTKALLYKKLKEKIKECNQLKDELAELRGTLEECTTCDNCASVDLNRDKIIVCENRIADLKQEVLEKTYLLEEKISQLKKNEETIIELEKERGKAIGFKDKYEILKQHVLDMEQKLSEKDSSVVKLTCVVEELRKKLLELEENTKNQIFNLESDLKKEKAWVKELRNQITKDERNNSHLQRDILTLKSGLEQANQVADAKKLEISSLQAELSLKVQAELKHRADLEHLQTEIHLQRSIVDKINKELEEVKARDPALAEQLKALSWRVKEKTNEVGTLLEKMKSMEERHEIEMSTLKKNLQETMELLETVKGELSVTRKEKFNYQSKVIELRKALKSKLVELESKGILKVENKYSDSGPIIHLNIPDPESSFDEQYVNSLLEKSMKLSESRPLNDLQDCLNSLKEEMKHLQQKIIDSVDTNQNVEQ